MTTEWETFPLPTNFFNHDEGAEKRRAKALEKGLTDFCQMCGRGVRPGRAWWVHVIDGGFSLLANHHNEDYAKLDDAGDMLFFAVGSECGREIPLKFRVKFEGE